MRERIFAALDRHKQFLDAYDPESKQGHVQSRLDKLEASWKDFNDLQDEISELDAKGEVEAETSKAYVDFEEQYYAIRAAFLSKLEPTTPAANLDNTLGRNNASLGVHTGSALKGEAAKLIESLTITNGNYIIAWDTITKRYSNEYLLKKRHLQALMEFPRIEKESAGRIHRLVNEFDQRLKILKQLGEKTEHWGAMIIHWMCSKLDAHTLQLWEDHAASLREPTFAVLVDFLEKRTRVLEAVLSNTGSAHPKAAAKRERVTVHTSTEGGKSDPTCQCCGELHYLVRCAKFKGFGLKEKLDFVNGKQLCSNCFKTGDWVRDCSSKFSCKTCGKKHNTLIHPGFQPGNGGGSNGKSDAARTHVAADTAEEEQIEAAEGVTVGSYSVGTKKEILSSKVFLSTVVVAIRDQKGGTQLTRALLDNGSQINLMFKRRAICVLITGVGQSESTARHAVNTTVKSRVTDFSIELDFLVLQRVTPELPSVTIPIKHWNIPHDLQMADPQFNISGRIDLLLGAEHFFSFLRDREVKRMVLGPKLPILVDSVFGWIVSGRDESLQQKQSVRCCTAVTPIERMEDLLEKFWRVESCDDRPAWSKEEQDCEEHFKSTHSRAEDGRYIVQLPKQNSWNRMLGESRATALDRYKKLENRLERHPDMKEPYHAFMKEYVDMRHMRRLTTTELQAEANGVGQRKVFYLPHHAVIKESSTTTKVRVVFDASARTDSGYSLNDVLLKGPAIQDDLLNLLIRFRKHEVALVGDVEKCIGRCLRVTDLTYGLTLSSFLATRALQQLPEDEGVEGTKARLALQKDFYVDDYIGGSANVVATIELRKNLTSLMAKGGFPIRKWCSNQPEVLSGIPEDQLDYVDVQLHCFADASDLAYGACLYVRSMDQQGNVRIELLSSKSRVAPLKRLTIPRLELCAAREAAHLYQTVIGALALDRVQAFFWSNSTVVLHWLKAPPNSWKTFIANRVSTIQTTTYGHPWLHVSGKENPADLVSRGMTIEDFLESDRWKHGPSWLKLAPKEWLTECPGSVPDEIHSDNATNFQGSKHELYELYKSLNSKAAQETIGSEMSQQGISWHLIPLRAPNFGGLWEAAVRSAKSCLKKEVAIPTNRLAHYQQRQQMFQRYWQRWSQEYITGLQEASKNRLPSTIRVGSIVILREDNLPPLQWPLARITEVHPGADGVIRVMTIKTSKGTYRRPANRICPLPTEDSADIN
ncbi:uncharacterized protein LOC135713092 [Ochlerotatus camptorhynchus]|uniref:uncharacterized protein LOC135713092 n=1 Tax=Ochlerotatus camptorhynchus TaxID=644619 RepID=UPI0031D3668B